MEIGAAFAGMSVAAIHLRDQPSSIRQRYGHSGANSRMAGRVWARMAGAAYEVSSVL
jgi:hypothetical protein